MGQKKVERFKYFFLNDAKAPAAFFTYSKVF